MRIRLASLTALLVVSGVGFVMLSHGQDKSGLPQPLPPGPPPLTIPKPTPAKLTAPTAIVPARKPKHNLTKLNQRDRQLYLSARRAAAWLHRMNEQKGRFVHGWQPSLNAPLEGDHLLRQAGAAFALARAARFFQDADHDARAKQAILALLMDMIAKQGEPLDTTLIPATVHRLPVCSLLVLAINELPEPTPDLLTYSEELCEFLRSRQQADGSLRLVDPVAGAPKNTPDVDHIAQYPGQALHALMRSHERKPAAWKLDVVRKAMPYYMKWWRDHKTHDFCCWHSAAYAEAFLATKDKAMADALFEMNDWLCGLQYDRLDPSHPQWLGGFQHVENGKPTDGPPDIASAICCVSLAEACRVTRQLGDLVHHERYTKALEGGLQFLMTLQYTEANTQHFAEWYRNDRLVGGFHFSQTDGNLRIDYTQHAVSALVQYLRWVVQVE